MSLFHRQRLLSGIRDSNQVSVRSDWAYAIRKQARLILVPLFRDLIIKWEEEKTGKRPFLTELAEELFRGFFQNGSTRLSIYDEVETEVSKFLDSLRNYDQKILGFYFLSSPSEVNSLFEQIENGEESSSEKFDQEAGILFQNRLQHLSKDEVIGFLMEELGEIENIISDSDLECGLDTEAITRINEAFSDYLDIPFGEISLIKQFD